MERYNISCLKLIFIIVRRPWTDEEDKFITDLVKQHGTKSWSVIADNLARLTGTAQRSGKQCRERWHNHLGIALEEYIFL